LVFVSESLREKLPFGKRAKEVGSEVIPNGIDCTQFRPSRDPRLRAELGLEEGALIIGAVGNVRESKRYDLLLEAFSRVRQIHPLCHLVVVGQAKGVLFERLLNLRVGLGLQESVHFLGFREDAPELMQGFDLFVLSSSDEGFSLATVQAMATGLPIVATRCGGPEEMVQNGVHGHLVDPNDAGILAEGILEVLSLPDRGEEYGKTARARAVSEFSMEAMIRRYEALYRRCLGEEGVEGG
jgi:glycosyltransferase involved in cell wall biosynthesis